MPFTPYHFGTGGLGGIVLLRWVNLPAFIFVNLAIDAEPLFIIVNNIRKYPEHGFFHSFAGATVMALLFSLAYGAVKAPVNNMMGLIKLGQKATMTSVVMGSVLGAWTHVLLDSFLYKDIMPFFPSDINPLYGVATPSEVRLLCAICAITAVVLYLIRVIIKKGNRE